MKSFPFLALYIKIRLAPITWWTYPKWGAYAAKGHYGQLIFVIPDHEMVVVFTARMDDDRPLVALIEDYIVPAVQLAD